MRPWRRLYYDPVIPPAGPRRSEDVLESPRRVLDPFDRETEVLFGLIMILTFTGSISVAESGREDVRTMLVAGLGCNLAWGIIDAVFYLMSRLAERGRALVMFRAVRRAADPDSAHRILADALPPAIASILDPADFERLRQRLQALPESRGQTRLERDDWKGAVGVFSLVFLTTFPVVIPFIVVNTVSVALRLSNAVAIVMLFLTGYAFGRLTGRRAWPRGLAMVVIGVVLVGLTIALGG